MASLHGILASVVFVLAVGPGETGEKAPEPGRLVEVDLNLAPSPPRNPSTLFVPNKEDLIQIFAVRSTIDKKDELLRTFKVTLEGDAVALMGIVEVKVRIPSKFHPDGVVDDQKRNLSCFLKPLKYGKSVLKITPVGEDGKDRPTHEVIITVGSTKKKEGRK